MRQVNGKIDAKQIQMIHCAIARLGLSDDEYRAILAGQYQRESCKALTYMEATRLIDYFKTMGFVIPPRKKYTAASRRGPLPGNVVVMPSRDQLNMIDALASKIAWKFEDGFFRWMKKYMKIDRVITAKQAEAVIEGLKKMLDHQDRRDRSPIDPHVSPDNPDDGAIGNRALQNIEE